MGLFCFVYIFVFINFNLISKLFVAAHQKSLDMTFSLHIMGTMMHCNIAPEEQGRSRKNLLNPVQS